MEFDINLLRSLGTVFTFIAFLAICRWAYSAKRADAFEEASQLPFLEDDLVTTNSVPSSKNSNSNTREKGSK